MSASPCLARTMLPAWTALGSLPASACQVSVALTVRSTSMNVRVTLVSTVVSARILSMDSAVPVLQASRAPCARSTLTNAPAHLARMVPNAWTDPMPMNAAVQKVLRGLCVKGTLTTAHRTLATMALVWTALPVSPAPVLLDILAIVVRTRSTSAIAIPASMAGSALTWSTSICATASWEPQVPTVR